jgi:branched-chain amino acid transport system substrate-binding protein
VSGYLGHLLSGKPGFTSLEGWLNAVVVTEALKRAGSNPSRQAFISALESLGGWDPGIGYKIKFSPTEHQGLHQVWLTKTAGGEWVAEPAPTRAP